MTTRATSGPRGGAWVLSQRAFERLLALFDPDREQAAERYEVLRRRLLRFFRWRGCEPAEELVDETLDRMARRIDDGAEIWASDPYAYLQAVARRVAHEHWRRPPPERPLHEVALPGRWPAPLEASRDPPDDRRLDCREGCLAALPAQARRRIEAYHRGRGAARIRARRELARKSGLSMNALRIRMFRLRASLLDCVRECLERGRRNESAAEA